MILFSFVHSSGDAAGARLDACFDAEAGQQDEIEVQQQEEASQHEVRQQEEGTQKLSSIRFCTQILLLLLLIILL